MKYIFLIVSILGWHFSRAQITTNILVPPGGLMDKQQLWNIVLTNTETGPLTIQVQVSFSESATGQSVFTAATSPILISPGAKQLSAGTIGPVQYNVVNANYRIDPGPSGLLPVGDFTICYNFLIQKYNKVVQECYPVNIPPLGPLLLNQPANASTLNELHPVFSWLPPSPIQSLGTLRYTLKLVELLPNQSPADAVQQNLPLFIKENIADPNYLYAQNGPSLLPGKMYAWQITAVNNISEISKSEIWQFSTLKKNTGPVLPALEPVFFKLKKAGSEDGYAMYRGAIRFDYFNETADTSWNMHFEDLSEARHVSFKIDTDSIKLKRGQNLVKYDATNDKRFIDKHQYLLQVTNSRNEMWQLRFEYRKQE